MAWSMRESAIARPQDESSFDGERGRVGVRDVAVLMAALEHEPFEDFVMSGPGHRDEHGIAVEPPAHEAPGIGKRGRKLVNPGVHREAEERQKARPGKTCRLRSVHPLFEPGRRRRVLGILTNSRVEQQVRVDQDHRNSSSSSSVRV